MLWGGARDFHPLSLDGNPGKSGERLLGIFQIRTPPPVFGSEVRGLGVAGGVTTRISLHF